VEIGSSARRWKQNGDVKAGIAVRVARKVWGAKDRTVRARVKGLARSAEKAWRLVRKPVSPVKSRVGGLAAVKGSVRIGKTRRLPTPVPNSVRVMAKGSVREVGKDVLRVPKVR